jgi:hypothetical protein
MSLVALANHLAEKGRGDDKMLVHMTPGEVQGLQALALAHGGSLTVNPDTGLVEAGFLKKLLPAIAGFALNFIAPGVGTAIGGMLGLGGAAGTAIAVGGLTGLATGSLKQGIMAGMGAYGGASLAGGITSAGYAGAQEAALSNIPKDAIERAAESGLSEQALRNQIAAQATQDFARKGAFDQFTSGIGALGTAAGRTAAMQGVGGASGLMRAGTAAMLGADAFGQPKTVTQQPGSGFQYPPRIRPMAYNQYTGGLEQLPMFSAINKAGTAPAPAPAPAQPEEQPPGGMAGGGIVALATGGPALPSDIGTYTPEQKADLYNKFLSQGFTDAAIRQAAGQQTDENWQALQRIAAQRGSPDVSGAERTVLTSPNWTSVGGQTGLAGLNQNIQNFVQQNPNISYEQVQAAANQYGVDAADIRRAVEAGGGSGGMQNVLTQADWRSRTGLTGLEGMNKNIQMWMAENPQATEAQIRQAMQAVNINDADVMRAMGKSVAELAYKPKTPAPPPPVTAVSPTFTETDTGTTITPAPLPGLPDFAPTTPTLLPATKFTPQTMEQVRTAYEQGGGATEMPTITRLGPNERPMTQNAVVDALQAYLANNPNATSTEITAWGRANGVPEYQLRAAVNERRFNMMTGGSKSAYDYLMGRGAYPVNQVLPGGAPLMRPYFEASGISSAGDFFGRKNIPTDPTRRTAQGADTGTKGITNQAALDRLRSTFDRSIFSQTPEAKAAYYNSLLAAGYDDATIRAAIDAPLDENWAALQAIAARLRAGTTGGGSVSSSGITGGGTSTSGSGSMAIVGGSRATGTGGSSSTGGSGSSTTGSGTPITDFLFGTQDASKVPVEDRTITRLPERQPEVSEYDPNAYDYDVGSGGRYTDEELALMDGMRKGGLAAVAAAGAARGGQFNLGGYSDGGRLLRGPGDGVSDSIPATIGNRQPARLADGEFVIPARIVSEIGNGSTEAGARKLYAMMDRVQRARAKTTGKGKVAKNTRADKYLPA